MKRNQLILLSLALLSVLLFPKCNQNDPTGIPYVPVDVVINVQNPQYFNLQVVTGWEYVNGGSRGLIVYRYGLNEFKVFDRHSTFEPANGCQVSVDSSNVIAQDPCSESRWSIVDGTVLNGPAGLPLQPYSNSFDGTYLHIFN